ncbi:hypothetical protein RHGRI_032889 [Rhododendron griersonianum]|uniref:Uncharacterized protein n=1 Tax=Rhododendron griersonianum TaxID=479676 RepID=A0AAV6IG10_9ERIC|nr:hypothetical protein RHGRI_032889 [Rhododendron griersonianum]
MITAEMALNLEKVFEEGEITQAIKECRNFKAPGPLSLSLIIRNRTMLEHKCYWKAVSPDMTVGVVFGLIAAQRYGTDVTDMSLWKGLQGRGDPYRTLLREATTALLNSYNSVQFPFHPLSVIQDTNWALMGWIHTPHSKFSPCK